MRAVLSPEAAAFWRRFKTGALWLVVGGIVAITAYARQVQVLSFPNILAPLPPGDPDVWLYLTETRQWLEGGLAGFFDHAVRNTNAPQGGVLIHWTRPMEMLLALAFFLTPGGLPVNMRLMLGANWLAPAICICAIALLARGMRRVTGGTRALGFAGLLMLCNPDAYDYMQPGNADHHGLLSMLWCGVLALWLDKNPVQGRVAALAGAALGVMVWISPEALAMAALVFGLKGLRALRRPEEMTGLAAIAAAAAGICTAALFLEYPAREILARPAYDTLSIVQVALLWACAAGAFGLAQVFPRLPAANARLGAAAVAGLVLFGGVFALYPGLLSDPLSEVDTFVQQDLVRIVTETAPVYRLDPEDVLRELLTPALALLFLGISLSRRLRPERRARLLELGLLLAATLGLSCYRARWVYYLHPVAILLAGIAGNALISHPRSPLGEWMRPAQRTLRPFLLLFFAFAALNMLIRQLPVQPEPPEASCLVRLRTAVQDGQLQRELGPQNTIVAADPDFAGDLLFFTPYRIIAGNFHREGAGLRDLWHLESMASASAARPLLKQRQVGALLFCPGDTAPESWLRRLTPLKHPAWLVPIAEAQPLGLPAGTPLKALPAGLPLLFRVKP